MRSQARPSTRHGRRCLRTVGQRGSDCRTSFVPSKSVLTTRLRTFLLDIIFRRTPSIGHGTAILDASVAAPFRKDQTAPLRRLVSGHHDRSSGTVRPSSLQTRRTSTQLDIAQHLFGQRARYSGDQEDPSIARYKCMCVVLDGVLHPPLKIRSTQRLERLFWARTNGASPVR